MNDETRTPSRVKRMGWAVGLLAGGALAGGLMAAVLPAAAASNNSASASASAPAAPGQGAPGGQKAPGAPGADKGALPPQRSDEKVLTGDTAAKVKAAALKAVAGGKVDRVETDADGATYEAHMTKSDGTRVTVKLDKNFAVTAVQDGMGAHK